jgi:mannitol/fructose-specific phosphotransferase system IIA component (Ntr-type)
MKLLDFVLPDALIADLKATERDDVIGELVDAAVAAKGVPKTLRDEIVKEIIKREKHGSTGFGKGVAVPHVKHPKLKKMVAAIGVSKKGVDFNALDKEPVYSVVLLLSPADKADEHTHADNHLQAMENIFSNLQKDNFRRFLRQANSDKEIQELLHEADTQQLAG